METSLFLAQFWGWLLVILGVIFLVKKKLLVEDLSKLVDDKGYALLSGCVALVLGLATIVLHNVWVGDWRTIITVLGWLSLLKGVVRIGFPETARKSALIFMDKILLIQALLVVFVFLGAWLVWVSY